MLFIIPQGCFTFGTMMKYTAIGAFSMALCIGLGAFGAHKLKGLIEPQNLEVFETGVKYHLIHSITLLILPLLLSKSGIHVSSAVWNFQILGIILFSGSLYILAIRSLIGIPNQTWIGIITPFGGLTLIATWIYLGIRFLKA